MPEDILSSLLNSMVEHTTGKKKLMEEILLLTAGQSDLVTPEKADKLLALIERKQDCIDNINKIDAEVLRLEEKILNIAGIFSWEEGKKFFGEKWETIGRLRNEVTLLIQEAQRQDEQNGRKISEEYRKLKKNMESLHSRRGSVKAYQGPAAQSSGYFIDNKK